jgi:putative endopeptidase
MNRKIRAPLALTAAIAAVLALPASAQHHAAMGHAASTKAAPVYDVSELDPSVSACQDFNAYANGKWVAANPIPADRTRWGAFDQLSEKSLDAQHALVVSADKAADKAPAGSVRQKIGWLYRSGMDEAAIERAGYDPVKPELAAIAALQDTKDIVAWLGKAFADGRGARVPIGAQAD